MGARSAGGTENHTWRAGAIGSAPGGRLRVVISTIRAVAPPVLLAVALLAAGCGGGDGDAAGASSPQGTAASSPSAEPGGAPAEGRDDADGDDGDDGGGDAPPFPATADPDTAESSAGSLVGVTDIRLGRHDGFDRVVFEVGGDGTPGWDVRYVDAPASQGSGDAVAVAGEAVLQVTVTGTGYPMDTGVEEWSGPDPLRGTDTEVVTEVAWDGTFEGTSVAFVGTTGRTPFRVYLLEGPARVVLEVAAAG
jgi:hypothetical protein